MRHVGLPDCTTLRSGYNCNVEPVTHFLTGSALSRAGLNRRSAYTTAVMVLAAEAPDLDVLAGLRGPVAGLQYHRGWTHTFLATPLVAIVTVAVVLGVAKLMRHKSVHPTRIGWLLFCGWIAALSHLALDWTNNYGLRPFLPWSYRWYQGEIVFILEPVMLAALLLAVIMPWIFTLTDGEIGRRKQQYRGRGWAWFALATIAVTWGVRGIEHHRALHALAQLNWQGNTPNRVMLSPYPVTPFLWHAVIDFGDHYQTARVNTWTGNVLTDDHDDVFFKPAVTPVIAAAEGSWLGRVYMDWSQAPLVTAEQPEQDPESPAPLLLTPVDFQDLRFAYSVLSFDGKSKNTPLSGQVLIGPHGEVVEQRIGHKVQK